MGSVDVGVVTKAPKVCMPEGAEYATTHLPACMQAPTTVPADSSKISIAVLVPVTLALAVAVSTTLSPGATQDASAVSLRCWASTSSDAMGTLGVTSGGANEPTGTFGSAAGSSVPSQAAGVLGPGLPAVTG